MKKENNNLYHSKGVSTRYSSDVIAKAEAAGITLVALVVTIIVLIILASVSINLVLGENGLVQKAQEAREIQGKAELIEQMKMEIIEKEADRIEEGKDLTRADVEIILGEYGTVNKNSDGTIKSLTPTDREYEISFEEIYNGTLGEISISDLKVGDYIKYDTGVDGIGEIMCRILYNDKQKGLQIISDKNVKSVTLGGSDWETGKTSYNAAITTLNNEAEKYLNTTYAIDARCVGSLPTVDVNGNFTQKDSITEKTVSISSDWTLPTGWTSTDTGCYDSDTNYNTDKTSMETSGIWITGEYYWIASHFVRSGLSSYDFDVCRVSKSGEVGSYGLCSVISSGYINGGSISYGLRPCFSLKSDIKITGGDGTSGNAYTL